MTTFIHDFEHNVKGAVSHPPGTQQSGDGQNNGNAVDMRDTVGQVHAVVLIGDSDDYSEYDVKAWLQESDDKSSWSDIDGSSVEQPRLGTSSENVNDNSAIELSQNNRSKRYVRAVVDVQGSDASSGASPTVDLASYVFGQKERY